MSLKHLPWHTTIYNKWTQPHSVDFVCYGASVRPITKILWLHAHLHEKPIFECSFFRVFHHIAVCYECAIVGCCCYFSLVYGTRSIRFVCGRFLRSSSTHSEKFKTMFYAFAMPAVKIWTTLHPKIYVFGTFNAILHWNSFRFGAHIRSQRDSLKAISWRNCTQKELQCAKICTVTIKKKLWIFRVANIIINCSSCRHSTDVCNIECKQQAKKGPFIFRRQKINQQQQSEYKTLYTHTHTRRKHWMAQCC